jgi:23S rRNA pseudouridine2605 synthase
MDNNEKKPKRPRIGETREAAGETQKTPRFERVNYTANSSDYSSSDAEQSQRAGNEFGADTDAQNQGYRQQGGYNRGYNQGGYRQQGGYGNRQGGYNNRQGGYNNRQGGYNNNRQGGYNNRQGGYNRGYNNQGGYHRYNQGEAGGYSHTPRADYNQAGVESTAEGATASTEQNGEANQGGYQPRNNYQRPYNNNRQGGYNRGYNQGGYGNNRQGGFNNNRQQGGFNHQGGNRQGGYNNRQGGYNNNRQGGYNNRQQGGFNRPQGKSFVPRPKRIEYEMPIPDPNEQIRLNKFMANAGICSRREADEFIQQGLVKVNGQVVTELGTKISHNDIVEFNDKVVTLESKCYILLNKPKDCVTTSDDPNGRLTVMDIVKGACPERIYPVGRLDRNTTGVLLLTNDGDLASKLTHPKYVKKKIYHVWCDKDIAEEDMQRIADGIDLDDGPIHADAISYATDTDRNQAGIEIHSGRNRIVRRIFESLGYHVTKLDRVYFAGLTKKNLPRGRWRYLTQEEVNFLKMGSFE